jgi:hypothetical protein
MPSSDRIALAHERLAARARRIRLIRRRVVAGTLATFALAWGVIVFEGSLGAPASNATAQVTAATATATSSPSEDSAATMTTSQS